MRQHRDAGGRVALGFRAHSGWAALVALRDPVAAPLVVQRRRLELIDHGDSQAAQPYHAAAKIGLYEAESLLNQCAESREALAKQAVRHAMAELSEKGYTLAGACILMGSGRTSNSLSETLASHTMIHTAEGDCFRDAIRKACESCGLAVHAIKEKEVWERGMASFRLPCEKLEQQVSELDEKLCTVGAWMVLAGTI
jgi:hypothetical protein